MQAKASILNPHPRRFVPPYLRAKSHGHRDIVGGRLLAFHARQLAHYS